MMALLTSHNVETGVYRLTHAPKDLFPKKTIDRKNVPMESAPKVYRKLFDQYLNDFENVYELAAATWNGEIEDLEAQGLSQAEAIQQMLDQQIAGPAAHPGFTWLIRKYWLACDELNSKNTTPVKILPETFLLEWLVSSEKSTYVQLVSAMPYWPIGLDGVGSWC